MANSHVYNVRHDAVLADILEEDDEFAQDGEGKYQYIEASCTLDGVVVKFERDELRDEEIKKWASQEVSSTQQDDQLLFHLKLLCFESDPSDEVSDSTLPCSKTAYEAIKAAWKLPDWILRFLDNRSENGLVLPYGALTASKHLKKFGLAAKNANSHQIFVMYDPDRRTTNAIIRGFSDADFAVDDLLDRLEKSQEFTCYPALAPFLLVEGYKIDLSDMNYGHATQLENVQKKQAIFAFDDEHEDDDEDDEEVEDDDGTQIEDLDLVGMGRELTKVYALSRSLQGSLEDALQCLSLVQTMHQKFLEGLEPEHQGQVADAWYELFERIIYVEAQARRTLRFSMDTQGEVQASIQTIYALIGTNDSQLNYQSAQASVRIAEDSRRVAILARQDSTDMRVIAGTTLFFLPATFVATLFSTNFFNFQPSTGLVSPWIWLYFATSAVLTVPVMLAWRLLSKARAKETAQILRVKDLYEDEEQGIDETAKGFTSGLSSRNMLQDIKNRLSKRKKTLTMEMEEK